MKIIKPSIGGHDGSSFRELLDMWGERGYCKVVKGPSIRDSSYSSDPDSPQAKCWINEIGDVLLYDFPLLDRLKHDYNLCLFSNSFTEGAKNKKWIFWPKHSRIYDSKKEHLRKSYEDREIFSGFIGAPTNLKRNQFAAEWSSICEFFRFTHDPIDHDKYLETCSSFKFGISLPGVGPKCLRDIEYMGMGTVPVFSPGVSIDYYDPLVEGIHYVGAGNPGEAIEKMKTISKTKWEEMSNNCIEWFEKNCSIEGSFKTTVSVIENDG